MDIWNISYKTIFAVSALIIAYVIGRLILRIIKRFCEANPSFRSIASVIMFFVKLVLYLTAFILILDNLGVEVGPLLASLGITGLAVSLALVDILKDLFAGIYILAERVVGVGDFVLLSSGESGKVIEVGWRSVKLGKESGEVIVIPNQKFYQSSITVKK